MTQLTRYRPYVPITSFRHEMDKVLSDFFGDTEQNGDLESSVWAPLMDLSETNDMYLVKMDLPGVSKEDVEINYKDGLLTISGERKEEKSEKDKAFHRLERIYGSFYRGCRLPQTVKDGKIEATFEDGVLNIRLPKKEESKPARIKIK